MFFILLPFKAAFDLIGDELRPPRKPHGWPLTLSPTSNRALKLLAQLTGFHMICTNQRGFRS